MEKRGQEAPAHMGDDPLELAAYATVHDHPGGADALVKVIGGSAEVLRNQVSLKIKTHKLGLLQARQLVLATGDKRIPQQFAVDCGGVFVPIQRYKVDGDVGLLDQFLAFDQVHGEFAGEVRKALDDGRITSTELAGMEQTAEKLIAELQGMIASMHARRDDRV